MSMTEAWILAQPADRHEPLRALCAAVREGLPPGFAEVLQYGMPSWSVPHARYPAGYHCDPKQPLPFVSVGSTKGHVALYHMGLYADPELMAWFRSAWDAQGLGRLDLGKSCVRFKKPERVPLALVRELAGRVTVEDWISLYERVIRP